MKLSGSVNGLSVPPLFAGNHDKSVKPGMVVHWHRREGPNHSVLGVVVCMKRAFNYCRHC